MMVMMVTALTEVVGSTMGEMKTVASTVVKMRVVSMLVMAETTTGVILRVGARMLMMEVEEVGTLETGEVDFMGGIGVILRVGVRMLMMAVEEVGTLERGEVDFMVILGTPEVTVMRGLMVTAMNMVVASMMGETMAVGETGSIYKPFNEVHSYLI